jgi:hypothetical protein
MDYLKKGQQLLGKSGKDKPADPNAAGGAPAQKQDYGDKAAEALAKQAGVKLDANQREKGTDFLRSLYEKFTGKKVDPKYSN